MTERSLFSLVVASLALLACTPRLTLEGRACPCAEGYRCCNVVSAGQPTSDEPICVARSSCESHLSVSDATVRQGGTLTVTMAGTGIAAGQGVVGVLRDRSGGLVASVPGVARAGAGESHVELDLAVPHGVAPGDYAIVFPLRIDGAERPFEVPVGITFISVSPTGDDAHGGTHDAPFATLSRAIAVAARGDTVDLAGGATYGTTDPEPRLSLPDGLTLKSDGRMAKVRATLGFAGDATVRGVEVTTLDAHVTRLGAKLVLDDVRVDGEGPEGALVVEAPAAGSSITIQGQSLLSATEAPLVVVRADDVTLSVEKGSKLETHGAGAAIASHGRSATLNIGDGRDPVSIRSWGADALIEDGGAAQVSLRLASLAGLLRVVGEGTHVTVVEGTFNASEWELTGGIQFEGARMFVSDGHFHATGITQNRPLSEVILRRSDFSYDQWGYRLTSGSLDLGHHKNPGDNEFTAAKPSAVALWLDGPDGDAAVTSCKTKIDGIYPAPFTVAEPTQRDTILNLEAYNSVVFYEE